MADPMQISLRKVGQCAFEVDDGRGHSVVIDGPARLGGTDAGPRPMEMFLAALASCSAVDVVMILTQQKQPLVDLRIHVEAERADAVPAVFTKIKLRFVAHGEVAENKMQRAVRLSVEKYCSVSKMLLPEVVVEHEAEVVRD
jgi:putative redox protein